MKAGISRSVETLVTDQLRRSEPPGVDPGVGRERHLPEPARLGRLSRGAGNRKFQVQMSAVCTGLL